ncbi:hypothetical protein SPRG_00739 [Saprolegnia parasitica CBS 223.65]|uniref:F-box domain-containing protein n=1 Tax=Saprolegnia parasitica (strain CBS 223.65) TaxID=695850 RepID=A0A067D7T2_SAPPC|nr:hypothetical protein SPRG_00739 [Saprolegnia parasitica CBS 223.65]KDO34676.1 hypothetical protein SPRG_00739 [Saprolegnia parasitica CBS 223.65]|eukprot:XP_012194349.1 hypothetical protein SPRG_00739 [Saprolegnia parasitica CBS 223.65]
MLPATALSWQSNVDIPMRRMMIQKLMWLFQHQTTFVQAMPPLDARLPSLVRRLELALYLRAASLDEYLNEHSVQRRVQSLIVALHHQAILQFAASPNAPIAFHISATKRPRNDDDGDDDEAVMHRAKAPRSAPRSTFLLDNHEDVLRNVFSFLDGRTIFACMRINRYTATFLPSCVLYLHVPRLDVFNATSTEPPPSSSQASELVVLQLARAMAQSELPNLRRLSLHATFVNTQARNGTAALCAALPQCPLLEELVLGGNALGDTGAKDVANCLLRQHCPRLRLLDLRRNYIGEGGMKDLAVALATQHASPLRWLLLGSNIACDGAVMALALALEKGHVTQLEFLGLEDNFVNVDGIHALAASFRKGACPALKELCIGDNIVENHIIQDVFAFALQKKASS